MEARLYVLPGSHPSFTAKLCLERKGIPYERKDLLPSVHKPQLRMLGFPAATVPALVLDGRKLQGSRQIAHALDELVPDPPLYPKAAKQRAAVEEAEEWGDLVLQSAVRRLAWALMVRDHSPMKQLAEGAKFPIPTGLALTAAPVVTRISARYNHATDEQVSTDLANLPGWLDRVDAYIADGVLGGKQPNAADFQIATSVSMLLAFEDLHPFIEGRPAAEHAERFAHPYPAHMPACLPQEWLEPLRAAVPAAA